MWFKNLSIFKKFIFTFILLVITPCTVWMIIFSLNSYNMVFERESERINQTIQLVKTNVELELEKYETKARNIYTYPSLFEIYRDNQKERLTGFQLMDINVMLKSLRSNEEYMNSICLFLENGQYAYASTLNASHENDIKQHVMWFERAAQQNGKGVWFPALQLSSKKSATGKAGCISYSFIVKDVFSDFKIVGTLFTNIDTAMLDNICSSVALGENCYLIIADEDGQICWAEKDEWIGKNLEDLSSALGKNQDYQLFQSDSEKSGWKFVAYAPQELFGYQLNMIIFNNVLIIAVLMFLFIICIAVIRKNIVSPIQKMAVVMDQFNTPEFEKRITVTGNDEIGVLAKSFLKMRSQLRELIIQIKTTEKREREEEIKALQAQINPHFLYNTLDTVYWMADEKGEREICDTVHSLSVILRYSISKKNTNASIKDEIIHIQNYINIQKSRFQNLFQIKYEIEESIYGYSTFKLILQPFVENAILHGFGDRSEGGLLIVRGRKEKENIVFEVEDNGCGMTPERIAYNMSAENERIGISNINGRIKLLYGQGYGVVIKSEVGEGTCVHIEIPSIIYENR